MHTRGMRFRRACRGSPASRIRVSRRRRLVRLLRSRRPALLPALWLELRVRRLRRRYPGLRIRPSDVVRRRPRRLRVRVRRTILLRWQAHLAGWLVGSVPAVLLGGWLWLAAGPMAFELLLFATTVRVHRPARSNGGGGPDGSFGAGDREPRRPLPVAGAGAAELPTAEPVRIGLPAVPPPAERPTVDLTGLPSPAALVP